MNHPENNPLWRRVIAQFRLDNDSEHGPRHWLAVMRNGLILCKYHPAEIEVVRLFALFHDSCRHDEHADPEHGPRGAQLAIEYRKAGFFSLDDRCMNLLVAACEIHNGAGLQDDSTIGVCLDADRLDLGRVGIQPDPMRLSTSAGRTFARNIVLLHSEKAALAAITLA